MHVLTHKVFYKTRLMRILLSGMLFIVVLVLALSSILIVNNRSTSAVDTPWTPEDLTQLSAGGNHSCAITDGQAFCWGQNSGQLGNGTGGNSPIPTAVDNSDVLAGKTVTSISAGNASTCAVADGQAYCWGANTWGQLGNGTTDNNSIPVAVDTSGALAGKTITAISTGDIHTCAIADGQPYCWGQGFTLGNYDTTENSSVPVAVDTSGVLSGKTVTAISAGSTHTCVVASGQAFCWGSNDGFELGASSMQTHRVPVAVNTSGVLAGKTVTAISAAYNHSCAVANGQAFCWGQNEWGQLGSGGTVNSSVPVAVNTSGVLAGKTVTAISVAYDHSCAVANGQASVVI